jgi:hypothetical protein
LPLPSQQPVGQLVELHWQAPPPETPAHCWPAGQATQAAPFAPHRGLVVPAAQAVPLQQPVGQSAGAQYATQAWLAHSLLPLHTTQAAPPVPHAALAVPGWQTPLALQQPVGQLLASQVHSPFRHSCPAGQATQAAPFAPQSAFVGGFTQVAPLQQPTGQSVGSQYATQACPAH